MYQLYRHLPFNKDKYIYTRVYIDVTQWIRVFFQKNLTNYLNYLKYYCDQKNKCISLKLHLLLKPLIMLWGLP